MRALYDCIKENKADKMCEEIEAMEWLRTTKFFSARKYAPIVLNIIDKLQKEIKSLQNEVMEQGLMIDALEENRRIAIKKLKEL